MFLERYSIEMTSHKEIYMYLPIERAVRTGV